MISDKLTNATNNGNLVDVVYNFDQIFGGWFLMAVLFAVLVVLGMSMYSWSGEFFSSFIQSSFIVSVSSFVLSLIRNSDGVQLFGFEKVLIFVTILALIFVGKKTTE